MTNNYLANIRVLIADDQTFTRTLVREILRTLGCRDFREAANGVDAWKEIEVSAPDLAIIDWEMHPGNGLELTRRLRDTSQSPNAFLPIIMMTAHAEKGYVMQARDAGVTKYLIKPISAKAILRRISEVIEHPRSFVRVDDYFGPDRRRKLQPCPDVERRGVMPAAETESPSAEINPSDRGMKQDEINAYLDQGDDQDAAIRGAA